MSLRLYRAFSTELLKIANDLMDSGIRVLVAERKGKEYLQGGRLKSNAPEETNFEPKLAQFQHIADPTIDPMRSIAPQAKGHGEYEKGRSYALTGLGGALTGGGVATLISRMKSRDVRSPKAIRIAAGIGTAAALGDKLLRARRARKEKTAFSPAESLSSSGKVGKFLQRTSGGVIGNKFSGAKAPGAAMIGRRFS